ncbi:MAG: hypothetical protein ACI8TP_003506 [Acidimicrobiales bacterium]|jgi:hypothetical protein
MSLYAIGGGNCSRIRRTEKWSRSHAARATERQGKQKETRKGFL